MVQFPRNMISVESINRLVYCIELFSETSMRILVLSSDRKTMGNESVRRTSPRSNKNIPSNITI